MGDDVYAAGPKRFADGRAGWVMRMMFGARLIVGRCREDWRSDEYDDGWCYKDVSLATAALDRWDGTGEPEGWHRHPTSGRRRPDGDPSREYVNP